MPDPITEPPIFAASRDEYVKRCQELVLRQLWFFPVKSDSQPYDPAQTRVNLNPKSEDETRMRAKYSGFSELLNRQQIGSVAYLHPGTARTCNPMI
jgi:hypothetical protein